MADILRFTNLEGFDKSLNRLANTVNVMPDVLLRNVGFKLFAGITQRTPVDTGYARANWLISTNKIDTKQFNQSGFPAGKDNSAKAEAINAKMVKSVKPDNNRVRLFITNSLPYIIFLEQGRTKQLNNDKGFMVQRTLATVTKDLDKEIKKLLNGEL